MARSGGRRTRRQFLGGVAGAATAAAFPIAGLSLAPRAAPERRDPLGPPRRKVRLAAVGGGFGAAQHWHEHPGCEVTAVSDLVEERRVALARRYSCGAVFPSLEEMLATARDTFDAVALFTDAPSHARHAIACMEAGKHVTVACPVALTLADCERVRDVKERTGLVYMMHESSWYRQPCIAARELHRAGAFGRLAFSEVEYYHPGICARSHSLSHWQGKRSWRYGFPPLLYPTHSLGLLVGVTGERIVKVACVGQRVGADFPEASDNAYANPFDNEIALGTTDQGNVCRFGVMWNVAAHGERGQWLGEKLSCFMDSSGGQAQARRGLDGASVPWEVPDYFATDRLPEAMRHDSGHGGSACFLAAEFIDALLGEREPSVDLYESIACTAPGIVAHESALRGGESLPVPIFDSERHP